MPFTPFNKLGKAFYTEDPRRITIEQTFSERTYFDKDVVFSAGASAQALARSANFSETLEKGWAIDGAGNASFYGTTILGGDTVLQADLFSNNWDGGTSVPDASATVGYYLDHSAGAAQFQNIYAEGGEISNLSIVGILTLGSSGVFRTAASGQRIELTTTDNDRINFYSGQANETVEGSIRSVAGASGATLYLQGPQDNGSRSDLNFIELNSEKNAFGYDIGLTSLSGAIRIDARGSGGIDLYQGGGSVAKILSGKVELSTNTDLTAKSGGIADRTLRGNFGCEIYANGIAQGITSTAAIVQFSHTIQDDNSMANLANNRIDIPVSGWYMVTGAVRWGTVSSGVAGLRLYSSAGIKKIDQWNAAAVSGAYHGIEKAMYLAAGDYVQMRALQTSGVTVNLNDGSVWEVLLTVAAMF